MRQGPAQQPKGLQQGPLLQRPDAEILASLEMALAAMARAFPVPASHRKDMPFAVRDLSRLLTAERSGLAQPYWAAPRFVAAYMHFFLPWNLYRLAWLLPGLALDLAPGSRVLDVGSGPLTFPLALWCARPDLRAVPLHFVCSDVAVKPMEHGRNAFINLSGGDSPWTFELVRAPLEKALRIRKTPFSLVTACNVFNELAARTTQERSLPRRIDELVELVRSALAPGACFFLLEPGTRLGGKITALTRNSGMGKGLRVLAPCTHSGPCPTLRDESHQETPGSRSRFPAEPEYSGWCHFIHPTEQVPEPLAALAQKARLEKNHLALSCLLLRDTRDVNDGTHTADPALSAPAAPAATAATATGAGSMDELDELEALYREIMAEDTPEEDRDLAADHTIHPLAARTEAPCPSGKVRIISGPIKLPGREKPARYACGNCGLVLLPDYGDAHSGYLIDVSQTREAGRDGKSGALVLRSSSPDRAGGITAPASPTGAGRAPGGGKATQGRTTSGTNTPPASQRKKSPPKTGRGHYRNDQ
ncbi:hypothetical protein LJC46_10095 [Desulfovibrio sp. OttesenSCG-928-G15]|nr:hypothetical protein [Desulfovibrio sp. OttesenSCG-928-G15]